MSDQPITRQTLVDILEPLKDDVKDILELLEKQNGRLRDAEKDLAVLKDRQPERPSHAGALAGSAAGGFVGVLVWVANVLWSK